MYFTSQHHDIGSWMSMYTFCRGHRHSDQSNLQLYLKVTEVLKACKGSAVRFSAIPNTYWKHVQTFVLLGPDFVEDI